MTTDDQDLAPLAAAAVEAFALTTNGAPALHRVARGAVGEVLRLETGITRYAVKTFFWDVDVDRIRAEVAFRDAAALEGIASPASIAGPSGDYLVTIEHLEKPVAVRLYTWVDGQRLRTTSEAGVKAAAILAGLHRSGIATDADVDPWYEHFPGADAWDELSSRAVAASAPWAVDLQRALPEIDRLAPYTRASDRALHRMCHLDVVADNLLDDDGTAVLVDWDNAGPGVPARELVSFLASWCVTGSRIDEARARQLLAAYRAAGGPAVVAGPEELSMIVATRINFLYVQAELALDTTAATAHRTDATARVAAVLNGLPRPDWLDTLLAFASSRP